jgi:hypothetical protein
MDSNESGIWRKLEQDFKAIKDPFNFLRADYSKHTPDPECLSGWRLTGGLTGPERAQFEAVARLAGIALWNDKNLRLSLPAEVLVEPDPLVRWLTAIRMKTAGYEDGRVGWEVDDEANRSATITSGSITRLIEWSIAMCSIMGTDSLQYATWEQGVSKLGEKPQRIATLKPLKKKELRLDETGLFIDGRHYNLKPNALTMWKDFFERKGEGVHQADFVFESRKAIKDMPTAVKILIKRGIPHRGYSVPRLQKQFSSGM